MTLEEMKQIMESASACESRLQLSKRFGVPRITIIGILNLMDSIEKAIDNGIIMENAE